MGGLMNETRALVTSCNGRFAPGAEALLRSAARFQPEVARYCFVPPDEYEALKTRLEYVAHVLPFPEVVHGIPRGNMVNVGRLFVVVPDVDVAAYIDADAVLCAPCDALWAVPPGGVNAIPDASMCVAHNMALVNRPAFVACHPEVARKRGVNTGVFALRRRDWLDLPARFEALMAEGRYHYDVVIDQPLLNALFAGHLHLLPSGYNAHGLWDRPVPRDVRIIHFTGYCKPWMREFPHHEPAYWWWLKYGLPRAGRWRLFLAALWIVLWSPKRMAGRILRQRRERAEE